MVIFHSYVSLPEGAIYSIVPRPAMRVCRDIDWTYNPNADVEIPEWPYTSSVWGKYGQPAYIIELTFWFHLNPKFGLHRLVWSPYIRLYLIQTECLTSIRFKSVMQNLQISSGLPFGSTSSLPSRPFAAKRVRALMWNRCDPRELCEAEALPRCDVQGFETQPKIREYQWFGVGQKNTVVPHQLKGL